MNESMSQAVAIMRDGSPYGQGTIWIMRKSRRRLHRPRRPRRRPRQREMRRIRCFSTPRAAAIGACRPASGCACCCSSAMMHSAPQSSGLLDIHWQPITHVLSICIGHELAFALLQYMIGASPNCCIYLCRRERKARVQHDESSEL